MSCTKQCASLHKTGIRLRHVGVFTSCDDDDDDDVDGECGCICNGDSGRLGARVMQHIYLVPCMTQMTSCVPRLYPV